MAQREFTSASFNQYLREKRLMAARCQKSGHLNMPPRPLCSQCGLPEMEWVELSGQGKLAAFTSIAIGPAFMNEQGYGRENPYISGIVALAEGPSISARILGLNAREPEGIKLGTPLRVEFLDVDEGEAPQTTLAFRAQEG